MATKAQLKEYFKSQKIPTEAQFGILIDSLINLPSTDITERPNQNLFFGNGEENPYIQGIRTISKVNDSSNIVVNMWIFSTYNNNDGELAIPMFILMRTNTKDPGLLHDNNTLRYCIPDILNIETFVQQGVDCNTSTDDDIFNTVYNWQFKPFDKDGGSEFPRVAYIDGQSAWDTWYNNFKTAHPESGNSGGSGSPILNQRVIDGYTFIIETSDEINFQGTETLEFLNCTIINNDTTEDSISMNFSGCVFRNCHLDSGYRISGGDFNSCSLLIDGNINNASINDCSLHGGGTSYSCNIRKSDVRVITLEAGNIEYSDIAHCILNDSVSVKGCKLHSCTIYGAKFSSEFTEMIGCSSAFKTAFNGSANEIKGFIFGCDFSGLEGIPGVMKGVQCCKFKSTLLSQDIILADIFGNKNASTNGMNTGV